MNGQKTLRGTVCAILGGVCWGVSGTVGQYLFTQKGIDSGWLTVVRMLCAGAILLAAAALRYPREVSGIWRDKKAARRLILFALFGILPCQYAYLEAIRCSNSATATVLQYLGQALVLFWACLKGRRLPCGKESLALVLALGGVFLLSTHGSFTALYLAPGALFCGLLAALAPFLYTTLPAKLRGTYPAPVCTGYGMLLGGIALCLLLRAWTYEVTPDFVTVLCVAEIVLVGTAAAFTLYLQGVSDLGGVKASLFACSEPVSAALCAGLWLKTRFAVEDIAGMVMIILMAALLALPEKKKEALR